MAASSMASDYFLIAISLSIRKSHTKVGSYRKRKSIDKNDFLPDLEASVSVLDPPEDDLD